MFNKSMRQNQRETSNKSLRRQVYNQREKGFATDPYRGQTTVSITVTNDRQMKDFAAGPQADERRTSATRTWRPQNLDFKKTRQFDPFQTPRAAARAYRG